MDTKMLDKGHEQPRWTMWRCCFSSLAKDDVHSLPAHTCLVPSPGVLGNRQSLAYLEFSPASPVARLEEKVLPQP
ncbi:hypothetical protein PgNI_05883, partial [Pyricularia grisea]|uniref:Uncharacterized protein n=1 Tax=Pyricularia grisea TaxID=148305 RepID=A0A6P8B7E3_PYRGI